MRAGSSRGLTHRWWRPTRLRRRLLGAAWRRFRSRGMGSRMWAWLGAFVFTQVVECPIYVGALRSKTRLGPEGGGLLPRLGIAFGASTLTHPVVWFVIPWLWVSIGYPGGYWAMVAAAEAFAVLAEAAYLASVGLRAALGWALVANAASLGLGLLSRSWFGWP